MKKETIATAEKKANEETERKASEEKSKAKAVQAETLSKEPEKNKSVAREQEAAKARFVDVFLHPLVSEKAVDMIEKENKITFITKKDADKALIKKLFEEEFKVKVDSVNIINDMKGRKKAIIKVNKQYKASEIAMKLGIL